VEPSNSAMLPRRAPKQQRPPSALNAIEYDVLHVAGDVVAGFAGE
jgi:hypothetical protein